jgi:ubiquinone/menaquinone biosynthesis C-methylase UbiE
MMMFDLDPERAGVKSPLSQFLHRNPFPRPLTLGFFYREKMRAIHKIAPETVAGPILEMGGGRGGLTGLLYPHSAVVNIDLDDGLATAPPNQQPALRFVCGDASRLPFRDASFGAVTMFDLIEHVPNHEAASQEALRVLRPGGHLLVSTPSENWRYPYHASMARFCPSESDIMARWGHVRRGYSRTELAALFKMTPNASAPFINALSVVSHDFSLNGWSERRRVAACVVLWPITLAGYALRHLPGTEWAVMWRKQ